MHVPAKTICAIFLITINEVRSIICSGNKTGIIVHRTYNVDSIADEANIQILNATCQSWCSKSNPIGDEFNVFNKNCNELYANTKYTADNIVESKIIMAIKIRVNLKFPRLLMGMNQL